MKRGIDWIADKTGLTKRTLRYYEEIGLLKPLRTPGKIRIYTKQDVEHIFLLLTIKEIFGFSLLELKDFMDRFLNTDKRDQHHLNIKDDLTVIKRHKKVLKNKLRKLTLLEERLNSIETDLQNKSSE